MTSGFRVPPKWAATSLVDRNGVLPAQAQPAFRRTKSRNPADFLKRRQLLLDGVRNVVLGEQFADASFLTFGTRTVVAPHVKNDGVVANAKLFQSIDQFADLRIGVLDEASEDFHQPTLERLLRFRNAVPRRHRLVARSQLCICRNPAELFLSGKDTLTVLVPTIIELAFVLVGPFRKDVMRAVNSAGCPVHQEWLVG